MGRLAVDIYTGNNKYLDIKGFFIHIFFESVLNTNISKKNKQDRRKDCEKLKNTNGGMQSKVPIKNKKVELAFTPWLEKYSYNSKKISALATGCK